MKIGLSTATFFGKEVTEDTFKIIQSMDISVCEVFMTTFSEYRTEFASLINQRKGNVEIYSVHSLTTHFEPMLFNMAERTRNDAFEILKMFLKNAQTIGAKSYTFHGPTMLRKIPYNLNYDDLGNKINNLIEFVESFGLELSYENVHWAYFNAPKFFVEIKARCPKLFCTMDIKQAMQSGLTYSEFLPVMADRLNNVHISDFDSNGNICVPGKGIVDFRRLFAMLRDCGYDKNLMLELYSKNYNNYDELYASLEYLKNILAKI